ncbi:MAG TPA: hypothetical protein PLL34_09175, partial [Candidatus Mcinerneyibacteriales bacterium]|nr:hypothetical protein [Candidatus Mcinerneyibacteriales bacterium]
MAWFKIIGTFFGLMALLKPIVFHLFPWDENAFLQKAYSEQRPVWAFPVAITGVALVGWTWVMECIIRHPRTIFITILFSLTVIKAFLFLVRYESFQKWVQNMIRRNKGRSVLIMDIG